AQRGVEWIDAIGRAGTIGRLEADVVGPKQDVPRRAADVAQQPAKLRICAVEQVEALLDPIAVTVAVGARAPAEVGQRLNDGDGEASVGEHLGAGEASEAAASDRYAGGRFVARLHRTRGAGEELRRQTAAPPPGSAARLRQPPNGRPRPRAPRRASCAVSGG